MSNSNSSPSSALSPNPNTIYQTGDEWHVPMHAVPAFNLQFQAVWHTLGEKVYQSLDSIGVKWTSIDPVRFAEDKGMPGLLYLWVGVVPGYLSLEDAKVAAAGCKEILADAEFPDVEIAFRESVRTW